jgi:iron(III) transport system permease protein
LITSSDAGATIVTITADALDTPSRATARPIRQKIDRDAWLMRIGVVALGAWLVLTVLVPVAAILGRSLLARDGSFVGLDNFARFLATPNLVASIANSATIAVISTVLCLSLAFLFAYGLTRTCMPLRGTLRTIAQIPLLAPSLLPAISLVYLFGNQGLLKGVMAGQSIYGPIGIVMGSVFWTFPHALLILTTALALSDGRLYEAAASLRAGGWRTFTTVTLPGARYGIVSAAFVVFTLVITDFGVPKVVGGQYAVLATDIYKQVVGQQNFEMGAVVGLVLLLPAVLAFVVDRLVQRRQTAMLTARAVALEPKPNRTLDLAFLAICGTIALVILGMIGVAFFASIATFWPYNLTPSWKNYNFDLMDGGGWGSYRNSLEMATLTAVFGATIVFLGAWLVEKSRGFGRVRAGVQMLALLPLAVPGLVLGLGYIFVFNNRNNPLNFLYGTMAILVICTISHFYSVAHLTATTALKQMDPEFETVSASLKVPAWRTFLRVGIPVTLPAILDVALYLFVNAMTTVSAVVFLYAPSTTLAAIAVLNMDDAGDVAPAAAMAMVLFGTSAVVRLVYIGFTRGVVARTQAWRRR